MAIFRAARSVLAYLARPEMLILSTANLLFIFYWFQFSTDKVTSMYASVYDLGIEMEEGWLVFHTQWTPHLLFVDFGPYSGILILSPLMAFGSFSVLLLAQTLAASLSSIPLYFAATKRLSSKFYGLLISVSYFIYFPVAGLDQFDFHEQIFFVPFFIAGYCAYVYGRYNTAVALMVVAGLFKFPYLLFPLAFVVALYVGSILEHGRLRSLEPLKERFAILLVSISVVLLGVAYLSIQAGTGVTGYVAQGSVGIANLYQAPDQKLFTTMLLIIPFLFIPWKSRFGLLTVPVIAVLWLYNTPAWLYPGLFRGQFSSGIVAPYYIAFIEGLVACFPHLLTSGDRGQTRSMEAHRALRQLESRWMIQAVSASLVIMCAIATVAQPFGPLNASSQDSFFAQEVMHPNLQQYNEITRINSLIPTSADASGILVENNIPEIFPRPDHYGLDASNPLAGPLEVDYNWNFFNNYTELGADGRYYSISPDFVFMSPYFGGPSAYYEFIDAYAPSPHNLSNLALVEHLYKSGQYAFVAEAQGAFLLERGYSGLPEYFVPLNESFPSGSFFAEPGITNSQGALSTSNATSQAFFYGPFTTLIPGTYRVTYFFQSQSNASSNELTLSTYYNVNTRLCYHIVNGTHFNSSGNLTSISYDIDLTDFVGGVQFTAWINSWSGHIQFNGIAIQQLGVP